MNPFFLRIMREPWAINPEVAQDYVDALAKLIEGKLVFEGDPAKYAPTIMQGAYPKGIKPRASMANSGSGRGRSGSVSLIPITTPLMKYDQECGPRGMLSIANYIKAADANTSIDGIILYLDSPGGTVAGTKVLGEVIRNVQKPIFAFVSDMAASGAYWLASQCDQIVAENGNAQVGSIGVMLSFKDVQPALEQQGVKFHNIVSSLSEDKNRLTDEVRNGEYDNTRTTVLDPLAQGFIDTVKSTRGSKITDETIFKGRMEFAPGALTVGLIDKIASLDETVSMVLAYDKKPIQTPNNPKSKMNKYPLMLAALGLTEIEADQDGYAALSEEQMAKVEGALVAANAATQKATDDLAAATAASETLTATIAAKDGEIAQLKSEKEAILKGKATESATLVVEKEVDAVVVNPDLAAVKSMTSSERHAYLKAKGY